MQNLRHFEETDELIDMSDRCSLRLIFFLTINILSSLWPVSHINVFKLGIQIDPYKDNHLYASTSFEFITANNPLSLNEFRQSILQQRDDMISFRNHL